MHRSVFGYKDANPFTSLDTEVHTRTVDTVCQTMQNLFKRESVCFANIHFMILLADDLT